MSWNYKAGSRLDFAVGLVGALGGTIGAPAVDKRPPDGVLFVLAWEAQEGGYPQQSNPLNIGPGITYDDLAAGVVASAHELRGRVFTPIGDAIKNTGADDVAGARAAGAALQASGWCVSGNGPCPGYGSAILGIFTSMRTSGSWATYGAQPAGKPSPGGANTVQDPRVNSPSALGAVEDITPGIPNPLDLLDALGNIAAWLVDPDNWRRAGMIAVGVGLAVGGLVVVNRDLAVKIGGTAAKAALL